MSKSKEKKRKVSRKGVRQKGNTFEREIAMDLRMMGFTKAGRHLEFQINNAVGVDIDHAGPFRIQCKNFQKYPSMSFIEEVQDKTGIPLLVAKANGKPPLVAIPWDEFLKIVSAWMKTMSKEKQEEHKWANPSDLDLGF